MEMINLAFWNKPDPDKPKQNGFEKYGENIKTVVLADTVTEGTTDGYQKEWKINGETVLLGVQKAQ